MGKHCFTAVAIATIIPAHCLAQVYLCDGIYRAMPCGQQSSPTVQAQVVPPTRAALSMPASNILPKSTIETNDSTVLITKRPNPRLDWKIQKLGGNDLTSRMLISGVLTGHGDVKVSVNLRQNAKLKLAWSKIYRLPDSGGSRKFEAPFALPKEYSWVMTAENYGKFKGYTIGTADAVQKAADEAEQSAADAENAADAATDAAQVAVSAVR